MEIIEHLSLPLKGEDRWTETSGFFAVLDGVSSSASRSAWRSPDGRTMGQEASLTAELALKELPAAATLEDYTALATAMFVRRRDELGLSEADRFASTALVLSKSRREIWSVGDSLWAYRRADGSWQHGPRGKLVDEVMQNYRNLILTLVIRKNGSPQTGEDYASLASLGRECLTDALENQMRLANLADICEPLAFGVLCGKPVPRRLTLCVPLPDDTEEVVLATDGFPWAPETAESGRNMLKTLRAEDPLFLGSNAYKHQGISCFVTQDGTIADLYDDATCLRIAV